MKPATAKRRRRARARRARSRREPVVLPPRHRGGKLPAHTILAELNVNIRDLEWEDERAGGP